MALHVAADKFLYFGPYNGHNADCHAVDGCPQRDIDNSILSARRQHGSPGFYGLIREGLKRPTPDYSHRETVFSLFNPCQFSLQL